MIYSLLKFTKILPFFNALSVMKILEIDFGHFLSSYHLKPINNKLEAIPWFTYPSIEYLNAMDLSQKSVFEYGSGNSTIYWTKRAKYVTSVESNKNWYDYIKGLLKRTRYILETNKQNYINSIKKTGKKFDLIIVDGDYRDECVKVAINYLKNGGFIILDNSDWFQKSSKFLTNNNLIEINFNGFAPSNHYTSTTSFYLTRDFVYKRLNKNKLTHIGGITPNVSKM